MPQVKLDHWRQHVLAALHAKQSIAQYAREHGLSRHTLYVAHKLISIVSSVVMPYG
jgi:DNA-binding phage protein